jgi:peptidylprolyl isomerase
MKLLTTLFLASIALTQSPANAQATAKATHPGTTHASAASHAAASGCVKEADLSPKIPALPAGAPCVKTLYTLTTVPNVKVEYASPQEASIREALGIESSTFSLNYVDTKVGTGELAAPHKWYSIHYTGYLVDGTKFDSSYDHPDHAPLVFQAGQHQVVAGWDTGFAGMRVGGKRRLYIPFQLAYGPTAHGAIPAKSELIFDLELISQSDEKPAPKALPTPPVSATPVPSPRPAAPPPAAAPAAPTQPATPPPPAAAQPAPVAKPQ